MQFGSLSRPGPGQWPASSPRLTSSKYARTLVAALSCGLLVVERAWHPTWENLPPNGPFYRSAVKGEAPSLVLASLRIRILDLPPFLKLSTVFLPSQPIDTRLCRSFDLVQFQSGCPPSRLTSPWAIRFLRITLATTTRVSRAFRTMALHSLHLQCTPALHEPVDLMGRCRSCRPPPIAQSLQSSPLPPLGEPRNGLPFTFLHFDPSGR